eukprot:scaffold55593_cov38-Cyclotella_meneghiniana.AAC.2
MSTTRRQPTISRRLHDIATTPLTIRLANLPPRQSFNSRPRHPLTSFQTSTTITRGTCNIFYHLPLFLGTLLDRRPPSMPHILVMI